MAAAGQFVRERIPVPTSVPEAGRLVLELVGSSNDSRAETAGPMTFRVVRRYRPTWATMTAFLVFPLFVRKTELCRIAVIEARAGAELLIEGDLDPALHDALVQLGRVPEAARVATLGPRPVPRVLQQQAGFRPPASAMPQPTPVAPGAPQPPASFQAAGSMQPGPAQPGSVQQAASFQPPGALPPASVQSGSLPPGAFQRPNAFQPPAAAGQPMPQGISQSGQAPPSSASSPSAAAGQPQQAPAASAQPGAEQAPAPAGLPFASPLPSREPVAAEAPGRGAPSFRPLEPAPPVGNGNGNGSGTYPAGGARPAAGPSWATPSPNGLAGSAPGLDAPAAKSGGSAGSSPVAPSSAPPLGAPSAAAPLAPPAGPPAAAAPPPLPSVAPPPGAGAPAGSGGPAAAGAAQAPTSAMPAKPSQVEVTCDSGERSVVGPLLLVGRAPSRAENESHAKLLMINDPSLSVSKTHLAMGVDPAGLWVTDRNSTNGTWIDEGRGELQRLEAGRRTTVPPGARVLIGERVLTFTRSDA